MKSTDLESVLHRDAVARQNAIARPPGVVPSDHSIDDVVQHLRHEVRAWDDTDDGTMDDTTDDTL